MSVKEPVLMISPYTVIEPYSQNTNPAFDLNYGQHFQERSTYVEPEVWKKNKLIFTQLDNSTVTPLPTMLDDCCFYYVEHCYNSSVK